MLDSKWLAHAFSRIARRKFTPLEVPFRSDTTLTTYPTAGLW